jgi:antitoxin MazE
VRASIQQTDEGLAVVIPSSLVEELQIQPDDALDLCRVGRELVMKHVSAKPVLEELVARITDANRHPDIVWGPAVGNEVW